MADGNTRGRIGTRWETMLGVIAVIFLFCVRVQGQGTPNKTYKKTPPYSFKLIAQMGDVVAGLKIMNFVTRYGAGAAINDAGQVAWVANTDKGTALFKDHTLVARAGQLQNGRKITDIADMSISQDGHVAYCFYYAFDPKRDLAQNILTKRGMDIMQAVCVDGQCIYRNGMPIKGLAAKVVSAAMPYYDDNGNLDICVQTTKTGADLFSGLVNGNYVKGKGMDMLRMKMVGRVVTGGQGRELASVAGLVQRNQKGYSLLTNLYTMNRNGMIAANMANRNIVIYPYDDGSSNATLSATFPLDKYSIPNFSPMKGMPGGDWLPVLAVDFGAQEGGRDSIIYSPHGRGIYINNSNQIAFFTNYMPPNGGRINTALILGTPQSGGDASVPVTPASGKPANVPLRHQKDYPGDLGFRIASADDAKTPFERWGCTLTSLEMLLEGQLSKDNLPLVLPDGTPLDPRTMNDYLKSVDNSVFEYGTASIVNYEALVKDISGGQYSWHSWNTSVDGATLQDIGTKAQEVGGVLYQVYNPISQGPHFVVVTGWNATTNLPIFNDPGYTNSPPYQWIGQGVRARGYFVPNGHN